MRFGKSADKSGRTIVLLDPGKPSFGSMDADLNNLASYDLEKCAVIRTPVLEPPNIQKGYYIELWNFQVSGSVIVPTPSEGLSMNVSGFQDLPCKPWSRELDGSLFDDFFPWAERQSVSRIMN